MTTTKHRTSPGSPDIVVVGSYFTDLVFYCPAFPKTGQTVAGSFAQGFGGKGSNQAIACKKLSKNASVMFFTAVGPDVFGDKVKQHYADIGLQYVAVQSAKPTGCAGIYVDACGQNQIVISQSAMEDLKLNIIQNELKEAIANTKLIVMQSEMNWADLIEILRFCHDHKHEQAKIVFNPAPFRPDYDYAQILPLADFFVPNETELEALSQTGVQIPASVKLIKTLGEAGVELDGEVIPTIKVAPVDTTGAGDCWIGGFCAAYIENGTDLR